MVAGAPRIMATTGAMKATVTTAMMVVTMTPNSNKDNKDGNSKNNNTNMTTPTTTTEGGENCQSRRDNCGGGHHSLRDAAIVPTAASLRHNFVRSCCFPVEKSILYYARE